MLVVVWTNEVLSLQTTVRGISKYKVLKEHDVLCMAT